ncbi:MAG: hypothetical protein Q7S65_04980 [Nanoarchaeota archaeon]|nr:hypothetical protein [Nanoarchaeota archaeon]
MRLPSATRFVDERLRKAFYVLEKGDDSERALFQSINHAMDRIEEDAFRGVQIPKALIPKGYSVVYTIVNLWKYNLPHGWRLLYSIKKEEVIVVAIILEWFSHKEYERRFKY